MCTCGVKFVHDKTGELLIHNGLLYSIDSYKCPKCGKKALSNIPTEPLCVADSDRADTIIQAMANKGYCVYGG